jgi:small subunit ribosomal protein S18
MRTVKKVHGTRRSSSVNRGAPQSSTSTPGFNPMYDNAHKRLFFRRTTTSQLSQPGAPKIDHKNIALLTKYISERGRILPQRTNNVSASVQRELRIAIKRARILALLPFVAD